MSLLDDQIAEKELERDQLETHFAANTVEATELSSSASRIAELRIVNNNLEKRINTLQEEIDRLRERRLLEQEADEFGRKILKSWELKQHDIDYHKPLIDKLAPVLEKINVKTGGTALFLVPDYRRMRAESLAVRGREWLQGWQKPTLSLYQLTFGLESGLDEQAVMTSLLAEFGEAPQGSIAEQMERFGTILFQSHPKSDTVITLEIKITLRKNSEATFEDFLKWFTGKFWQALNKGLSVAVQNTSFVRVVVTLMTELRDNQIPPQMCVDAPNCIENKCSVILISPWTCDDVETWVHKCSHLSDYKYADEELDKIAYDAYSLDQGLPYSTWHELMQILQVTLADLKKRLQNGELA